MLWARAQKIDRGVSQYTFVDCGLCPIIYSRLEAKFIVRIRLGLQRKRVPDGIVAVARKMLPLLPDAAAGLSFFVSRYSFFFSKYRKYSWCVQSMRYNKGSRFGGKITVVDTLVGASKS